MAGVLGPGGSGIRVVGVVGAGTMGAGIAQVALEAGHEVVLHDVDEPAIELGRARIRAGLERRAARLELDGDSMDDWVAGRLAGLRDAHSLDAVGAEAGIVIEAALEELELKQTIFRALDAAAAPEVILATNTSALPVAAIAISTTHPERVLGLHFFNPAPVMALVEVVAAPATEPAVVERAVALMSAWGKTPVRCADTPGFIVNRVNRPFTIEALAILAEGRSSIERIDAAMRDGGFPLGPFELIDLAGVDVNLAASQGIWQGLGGSRATPAADRLRPSPIQVRSSPTAGLGRKTERRLLRLRRRPCDRVGPAEFADRPDDPGQRIRCRHRRRITPRDRHRGVPGARRRASRGRRHRPGDAARRRHPIGPFERAARGWRPCGGRHELLDSAQR